MQDLHNLELVVRLARCGSLAEAARAVGMSSATASKAITRLEAELGTPLFVRTTRRVTATWQGQLLAERFAAALNMVDEGLDDLRLQVQEPKGVVRVLMGSAIGKYLIMPLIPAFLEEHPGIDLEISFWDSSPDAVQERFDVAVADWVNTLDSHVAKPLCTLPIILVASSGYLAQRGIPRTIDDLRAHCCINTRLATGQITSWDFVQTCPNGSITPSSEIITFTPDNRVLVLDQLDGVIHALLADVGVSLAYAQTVLPHLDSGKLQILLPQYDIGAGSIQSNLHYIRFRARRHLPMAARLFIDFLLSRLGNNPAPFDRWRYAA